MKILVAIPCMDILPSLFCKSLVGMRTVGDVEYHFLMSSLIYDARNQICGKVLQGDYDRVLWLDSDMVLAPDTMERLSKRIDEGLEYVSGLYISRKRPFAPTIYKELALYTTPDGKKCPDAVVYRDYPHDSVFEIQASGMGVCMMTAQLVKDMTTEYGLPFSPVMGFGEDFSFCLRVAQAKRKMYCDSSIRAGHIGYMEVDEETYYWEESQRLGVQNG